MALKKIHDPAASIMRIAGFISGSGTNLRRILEHQVKLALEKGRSPYEVAVIFSDNAESNACQIGRDYDIPVLTRDIRAYYKKRGRPRRDMTVREEYDRETLSALASFRVQAAAFAGYMSVASRVLVRELLAINVHPADLSIREGGQRKFKGDHAVSDAILAGEKTVASTTHIVEPEVDEGRILMVSPPVTVEIEPGLSVERDLAKIASACQEKLKQQGDWVIFPSTIQLIAEGRFEVDESGLLHFDGKPVPDGIRYGAVD
jgi:phosphoribosylglycinamide formyltransferase-1